MGGNEKSQLNNYKTVRDSYQWGTYWNSLEDYQNETINNLQHLSVKVVGRKVSISNYSQAAWDRRKVLVDHVVLYWPTVEWPPSFPETPQIGSRSGKSVWGDMERPDHCCVELFWWRWQSQSLSVIASCLSQNRIFTEFVPQVLLFFRNMSFVWTFHTFIPCCSISLFVFRTQWDLPIVPSIDVNKIKKNYTKNIYE